MELNENAEIDTSQVEDVRGSGGGGGGLGGMIPVGGGGLTGIVITVILLVVGGYFGVNNLGGGSSSGDNTSLNEQCAKENATETLECRNVLYINSIQAYWAAEMPKAFDRDYEKATTKIFSDRVSTGCGTADSGVGPFYCPSDDHVYIDLTFYQQLADELGAPGEFAQPYVLAHEYGHHVQDLLGTDSGGTNLGSVKLELQADCYAGAWAKGATSTSDAKGVKIFKSITDEDIQEGLQTAGQIGDDTLQKRNGGTVNPAEFTHGTSADRQKWFRTGYDSADPAKCDTFADGAVKEGD
ncbi:neutral zinc metallopeptidase [Actinoplanes sp. NPDC051851]|uniref:KPN_02809 family neutral zinc metallopeptidase n=1 Tax=Actinoplanes sp. NPDC051851 TaxID=3154753 RepID=UPI00341842A9